MKNKISRLLMMAGILWATVGCEKFLDVNISPNVTVSNPPNLILTSVEAMTGFMMGSDLNRYSLLFSQQIAAQAGRQTEAYDAYVLQPTEVNTVWRTNLYGGALADIEEILKKSPASTHPHYFGISKILKAYLYSNITDTWGDVPFSEAHQGVANLQPKLDPSSEIYPKLITLLDEGIAEMRKTSPLVGPSVDDYIYGGSANSIRWIRMANTLKLRLYLHWLNAGLPQTTVSTFIANTPATEFMTATTDDFQHRFDNQASRQNPIHQFIILRVDDICVSSTVVNLMNSKADPRRSSYFTPAPFSPAAVTTPPTGTTGYVGLRNGTGAGGIKNDLSRMHTYVRGGLTTTTLPSGPELTVAALAYDGTSPVRMLTFAEYNFIRAELALRYGGPGTAQAFYEAGIRASMANAGRSAAAITAYLATPAGTLEGTPTEQLKELIEEKYVANFMVALEPWNDWRRTGFPLLNLLASTTPNLGNGGRVPRTLIYPQQEVDANPKMTQKANLSDKPVFWDTRTTGQQ